MGTFIDIEMRQYMLLMYNSIEQKTGSIGMVCVFKCKLNLILASAIRQIRLAKKTWISVFKMSMGWIKCSGGWGWVRGIGGVRGEGGG